MVVCHGRPTPPVQKLIALLDSRPAIGVRHRHPRAAERVPFGQHHPSEFPDSTGWPESLHLEVSNARRTGLSPYRLPPG